MSEEVTTFDSMQSNIIENAEKFSEFLSSEPIRSIQPKITIIPNLLNDILNYAIECKKVKSDNNRIRSQTELANKYLDLQERNSQRYYAAEIEKSHMNAEVKIQEIEYQTQVKLADIKADEHKQLEQIRSNEHIQITKLKSDYELALKRQNNDMKKFLKTLKESNYRFKCEIKNLSKVQAELGELIKVITIRITQGQATTQDYDLLKQITLLKVQALDKNFDISEGLMSILCGRG